VVIEIISKIILTRNWICGLGLSLNHMALVYGLAQLEYVSTSKVSCTWSPIISDWRRWFPRRTDSLNTSSNKSCYLWELGPDLLRCSSHHIISYQQWRRISWRPKEVRVPQLRTTAPSFVLSLSGSTLKGYNAPGIVGILESLTFYPINNSDTLPSIPELIRVFWDFPSSYPKVKLCCWATPC
jgi:hypothetical protein